MLCIFIFQYPGSRPNTARNSAAEQTRTAAAAVAAAKVRYSQLLHDKLSYRSRRHPECRCKEADVLGRATPRNWVINNTNRRFAAHREQ